MNAILRYGAVVLAVVALVGCRTGENDFPRIVNEPMPVPPKLRSSFGVIGILPADLTANFEFGQPATPSEAAGVIGTKAFVALADSSMQCDEGHPGRQLGGLAFSAALAGVIGVFGGVLVGVPEGDVKRAQTAMNLALQENPLEPGIQAQLQRLAVKKQCRNLVPIPKTIRARLNGNAITKNNLRILAGSDIDSVLCLHVDNEQFMPGTGLNPPMAVNIILNLRIVRIADGKVLFDKTLEYQGNRQTFTNWGDHQAKLFRAELELAQRIFAGTIFNELSD